MSRKRPDGLYSNPLNNLMQTLTISQFPIDGKIYQASIPVSFQIDETPMKEDNGNIIVCYSVESEDYNISVFGHTSLDDLFEEVQSEMAYNWSNYALADSSHLSDKAKIVKQNYLENFHAC